MTAGKRLAGGDRLLVGRAGGRFQQECCQQCVECLEERIAPASEEPVHVLAEGSEPFPFWCVHIQQDGHSSLFLSPPPQTDACYGLTCKLRHGKYGQAIALTRAREGARVAASARNEQHGQAGVDAITMQADQIASAAASATTLKGPFSLTVAVALAPNGCASCRQGQQ